VAVEMGGDGREIRLPTGARARNVRAASAGEGALRAMEPSFR
jgi:hypothetical protein